MQADRGGTSMTLIDTPPADRHVLARRDELIAGLVDILGGQSKLIVDEYGRRVYASDAMSGVSRLPLAVVFPTDTRDVSRVLRYCYEQGIRVFARGGGTSLTGAAVPAEDGIVLCLTRMNRILAVDLENRLVTAEAGVTTRRIAEAAASKGLRYAPDPASGASATIGGTIATNAGGPKALRYGPTSAHVAAAELVLLDGEVIQVGSGELETAGLPLLEMALGGEGLHAVVTTATLRLTPRPDTSRAILVPFGALADAAAFVSDVLAGPIGPSEIEAVDRPMLHVAPGFGEIGVPMNAEMAILLVVEGSEQEVARSVAAVRESAARHNPLGLIEPETERGQEELRRAYQGALGSLGRVSNFLCADGCVPQASLAQAIWHFGEICTARGLRGATTAHAGEGALQFVVFFDAGAPGQPGMAQTVLDDILLWCLQNGGGLSAAHGIGLQKREIMARQYSEEDLELRAQIKTAFDPEWLLNPGKVLSPELRTRVAPA